MTTEPLPRTGTEVVVELRGIKKSFGSTEVLHGVDLTIHTGEHVVATPGGQADLRERPGGVRAVDRVRPAADPQAPVRPSPIPYRVSLSWRVDLNVGVACPMRMDSGSSCNVHALPSTSVTSSSKWFSYGSRAISCACAGALQSNVSPTARLSV